jgi:hypothetical protein
MAPNMFLVAALLAVAALGGARAQVTTLADGAAVAAAGVENPPVVATPPCTPVAEVRARRGARRAALRLCGAAWHCCARAFTFRRDARAAAACVAVRCAQHPTLPQLRRRCTRPRARWRAICRARPSTRRRARFRSPPSLTFAAAGRRRRLLRRRSRCGT